MEDSIYMSVPLESWSAKYQWVWYYLLVRNPQISYQTSQLTHLVFLINSETFGLITIQHISHFLYPFTYIWVSLLILYFGYWERFCKNHRCEMIFLVCWFRILWVYAHRYKALVSTSTYTDVCSYQPIHIPSHSRSLSVKFWGS